MVDWYINFVKEFWLIIPPAMLGLYYIVLLTPLGPIIIRKGEAIAPEDDIPTEILWFFFGIGGVIVVIASVVGFLLWPIIVPGVTLVLYIGWLAKGKPKPKEKPTINIEGVYKP